MIITSYLVECDGPHPEWPDEQCEARFDHVVVPGRFSDAAGLRHEIDGRGWQYRGGKFYCSLHTES